MTESKQKWYITASKAVWKALKWFFRSFIWLGLIVLAIDIVSKLLVVANITVGSSVVLIPNFLQISCLFNEKAAFGIGFDDATLNRIIYIVVALIGMGIMLSIYGVKYRKLTKYVRACLILMATGALGNMIDRMFYRTLFGQSVNYGVVDWIDFCGIWKFNFNIADSCVVIGTLMLIVWLIVEEVKEYKIKKASEPKVASGPVLSEEEKSRLEAENKAEESQEKPENTETKEVEK